MKRMSVRAVVEWAQREGNSETDRLANGENEEFDPALRIPVDAASFRWDILPEALAAGQRAETRFQEAKQSGGLPNRTMKQRKRKVEERLKARDPW